MKKKNDSSVSNTKIAIVFFAFLAFIVGISLTFKAIAIIRAGQFDGSKRFTLSITSSRGIEVMSLSPSSKDIVIFKLEEGTKHAEAGRILKIPIDGFISHSSLGLNRKINSLFIDAVLRYNSLKTNLTIIDLLKIVMFTRSIPESAIHIKKVGNMSGLELDKIVGRLVNDHLIEKDNQTIRIINAAGVSGLGNRLARFITNMGGNVIIVATDNNIRKKSVISYIDEKTYTAGRLQKVLGYEVIREPINAISDITIIIGDDKLDSNPF